MVVTDTAGEGRIDIADATADDLLAGLKRLDGTREIELLATSGAWMGIAGKGSRFFLGYLSGPGGSIRQALSDKGRRMRSRCWSAASRPPSARSIW